MSIVDILKYLIKSANKYKDLLQLCELTKSFIVLTTIVATHNTTLSISLVKRTILIYCPSPMCRLSIPLGDNSELLIDSGVGTSTIVIRFAFNLLTFISLTHSSIPPLFCQAELSTLWEKIIFTKFPTRKRGKNILKMRSAICSNIMVFFNYIHGNVLPESFTPPAPLTSLSECQLTTLLCLQLYKVWLMTCFL